MDTIYKTTLSPDRLANLSWTIADVRESLDLILKTGRYSLGLVLEFAQHLMTRRYNTHKIYDEIRVLEGTTNRPTITKPAAPFKRPPLIGLWHKHHFQAAFIPRNLSLEMSRPGAMDELLRPYFGRYMHEVMNEISYAMTIKAYEARAGQSRMTGEWIVYEPGDKGNYYLTLGRHDEPGSALRARVEAYREADRMLANSAAQ